MQEVFIVAIRVQVGRNTGILHLLLALYFRIIVFDHFVFTSDSLMGKSVLKLRYYLLSDGPQQKLPPVCYQIIMFIKL